MSKLPIIGWCAMVAGIALWTFGYFVTGHPSLIDWNAYTPWWIADFLPNIESEIGMALAYARLPHGWGPWGSMSRRCAMAVAVQPSSPGISGVHKHSSWP